MPTYLCGKFEDDIRKRNRKKKIISEKYILFLCDFQILMEMKILYLDLRKKLPV